MAKFTSEIIVKRPLKEVWGKYMDPANHSRWISGYRSSEPIQGNHGEEGSRHRYVIAHNGRDVTMEQTVTAVRQNEEFAYVMRAPAVVSEVWVDFSERGPDATKVIWNATVKGSGLVSSMGLLFSSGGARKRVEADLSSFKKFVESS